MFLFSIVLANTPMQAFYISQCKLLWPRSITLLHPEGNQLSFPSWKQLYYESNFLRLTSIHDRQLFRRNANNAGMNMMMRPS